MDLKLFVWHKPLKSYGPGIAFALAHDVQEAKELLVLRMYTSFHRNELAHSKKKGTPPPNPIPQRELDAVITEFREWQEDRKSKEEFSWYFYGSEKSYWNRENLWDDLEREEPTVYDVPCGFYRYGSD